jgi:hypothetical protein
MVKAPFCHPVKRSIDSHTNGLNSGDKGNFVSGDEWARNSLSVMRLTVSNVIGRSLWGQPCENLSHGYSRLF